MEIFDHPRPENIDVRARRKAVEHNVGHFTYLGKMNGAYPQREWYDNSKRHLSRLINEANNQSLKDLAGKLLAKIEAIDLSAPFEETKLDEIDTILDELMKERTF